MEGRHSPRPAPETLPEERLPEEQRPRRRKKRKSVARLVLQDILLTGLVLLVFAFFHHVLPRLSAARQTPLTPVSLTSPAPAESAAPLGSTEPDPAGSAEPDPAGSLEPTPEPTPDPMDWKSKFADWFTDEVVVTENSYTSPGVAIHIETVVTDDPAPTTYFVADIHIASLESFRTHWAGGSYRNWAAEAPLSLAQNAGAILSINGDYADNQYSGLLIRNGELYLSEQTVYDICVLYADGTMATYGPKDYTAQEIIDRQPWQVWKFGPALLDENGQAKPKGSYNTKNEIAWDNPRSGLGYYEPGHYCFVVVDGRQPGYSRGLEIERFAQVFADLGCRAAYNMDGGASAVMCFDGRMVSRPSNGGRDSGDILLIREPPQPETGDAEYP